MEKQYKRVSEDLLDYMKDMYGVINTDTIPAKIVMEEFDCNGFINNAGEEVDPRTTVRFPKGVVILTNKNGSKISIGKKGETTTNKKYPFDVIIDGKTSVSHANTNKTMSIYYSDIQKMTFADYETSSDYCSSIIDVNIFNKLLKVIGNDTELNDIKNIFAIYSAELKSAFRTKLGLEFVFDDSGELYNITNSQLATNLNGVSYFILRIIDPDKLKLIKDEVVRALSSVRFIIVADKSGINSSTNGIFIVNDNYTIKSKEGSLLIHRNSLVFMESIDQVKKINSDIANGSENFVFLINTNDTAFDKFKNNLTTVTNCNDDTTSIPVLENIVSYICQFGRMFYNFLSGDKTKSVSDTNYSVSNLKEYKVLSEIYNNNFNKLSQEFKHDFESFKTSEELSNLINKYYGNYGLVYEGGIRPVDSIKMEGNVGYKTKLYNILKEEIDDDTLSSIFDDPNSNGTQEILKDIGAVKDNKTSRTSVEIPIDTGAKLQKTQIGNDDIVGYIKTGKNTMEYVHKSELKKMMDKGDIAGYVKNDGDEIPRFIRKSDINPDDIVKDVQTQTDKKMNEDITTEIGNFLTKTATEIETANKDSNDTCGDEEGDKIKGAFYYRSLKEAKEKSIRLSVCVQKEMQRLSANLEGYKFLENEVYDTFNKELSAYSDMKQFSIEDSSPNDSTAKELTEKAEQITNPKESISLYNIKSNLFKILTEADDKKQYYEFLGSVSLKNNADYNLISSYGRGDNTKVADCFIGTSKLKSAEASLANWSSVIDRYANELASLGSWLDQTYIKTGTSLTTRATDTAKTISKAGKTVAGLGDKISGKSK